MVTSERKISCLTISNSDECTRIGCIMNYKPLYTLRKVVSIRTTDKLSLRTAQRRPLSCLRGEGPEAPKEKQLNHTVERYRLSTLNALAIS